MLEQTETNLYYRYVFGIFKILIAINSPEKNCKPFSAFPFTFFQNCTYFVQPNYNQTRYYYHYMFYRYSVNNCSYTLNWTRIWLKTFSMYEMGWVRIAVVLYNNNVQRWHNNTQRVVSSSVTVLSVFLYPPKLCLRLKSQTF